MLAHLLGAPITCTACHKMSHLCCVVFVSIVSSVLLMSHLLVVPIRHCDMMGMQGRSHHRGNGGSCLLTSERLVVFFN